MGIDTSAEQNNGPANTEERIRELKEMGDSSWANMLGREVVTQVARMQSHDKLEDAQNQLRPLVSLIAEVKADPGLAKKFIEGVESTSEVQSVSSPASPK